MYREKNYVGWFVVASNRRIAHCRRAPKGTQEGATEGAQQGLAFRIPVVPTPVLD